MVRIRRRVVRIAHLKLRILIPRSSACKHHPLAVPILISIIRHGKRHRRLPCPGDQRNAGQHLGPAIVGTPCKSFYLQMPVLIRSGKIRLSTVRTIAVRIGLVCNQRDRSCRHDEFILCRCRFADLPRSVSSILISAGDAAHSNLASCFTVQYVIQHLYIAIGAVRQGYTLRQPELIVGGNVLTRSFFRLKFLNKVRKIIRRPIDCQSSSVCQFCINVFTARSFRHNQRIICAGDQNAIFSIIRRVDACAVCNEDSGSSCQLHCPCSIIRPFQNQAGTLLQCQISIA